MLKIGICDGERRYAEDLEWCISVWAAGSGTNVRIRKFRDGASLLSDIREKGIFDILFLDIGREKINGLEIAARIRETDYITSIIFVSQYEDYYKEAYDAHPFHFLHKPVNPQKVEKALDAYMKMKGQDIELFTFVANKARYNLRLDDIIYFYSERRHVNAVCVDKEYSFYGKLCDVQKSLEEKTNRFLRIHQSYLVNMKCVKEYHYNELVMYNGRELYISKENRKKMRDIHMMLAEL